MGRRGGVVGQRIQTSSLESEKDAKYYPPSKIIRH